MFFIAPSTNLRARCIRAFLIEVELRLLQHHETAVEETPAWIAASYVVAVVVEEMSGDVLLREELQQPLVEFHFREGLLYFCRVLDGYVALSSFGFQHEAVVFSPQRSGPEKM